MAFSGYAGMLKFLKFLNDKKVQFKLEQQRDDALMVSFAMIRHRVEVEFFEDHIEYSVFTGTEDVLENENELLAMIEKYGS